MKTPTSKLGKNIKRIHAQQKITQFCGGIDGGCIPNTLQSLFEYRRTGYKTRHSLPFLR